MAGARGGAPGFCWVRGTQNGASRRLALLPDGLRRSAGVGVLVADSRRLSAAMKIISVCGKIFFQVREKRTLSPSCRAGLNSRMHPVIARRLSGAFYPFVAV